MNDDQILGVYNDAIEAPYLTKKKYEPPMLIVLDDLQIASGSQGIFENSGGSGPINHS